MEAWDLRPFVNKHFIRTYERVESLALSRFDGRMVFQRFRVSLTLAVSIREGETQGEREREKKRTLAFIEIDERLFLTNLLSSGGETANVQKNRESRGKKHIERRAREREKRAYEIYNDRVLRRESRIPGSRSALLYTLYGYRGKKNSSKTR